MDMVTRVATAIVASIKAQMDGLPIPGDVSPDSTGGVIDGEVLARAAIEAMRTPTDEMVEAGSDAPIIDYDGNDPRDVWRLMIDAALTSPDTR